jgi:hypothetical protein
MTSLVSWLIVRFTYPHPTFGWFPSISTHIRIKVLVQFGTHSNKGGGRSERIRDAEDHGNWDDHVHHRVHVKCVRAKKRYSVRNQHSLN